MLLERELIEPRSLFDLRYREWAGRLKPTLRQVHVAGEKLFVDYSDHTMEVVDGLSGEVRSTQIFVAVLCASNYTYAEASLTQSLPDWIASRVRAFAYFGGVARQTVSDNLKAGITRARFHEPMSTGPMPVAERKPCSARGTPKPKNGRRISQARTSNPSHRAR